MTRISRIPVAQGNSIAARVLPAERRNDRANSGRNADTRDWAGEADLCSGLNRCGALVGSNQSRHGLKPDAFGECLNARSNASNTRATPWLAVSSEVPTSAA